MAFQGGSSTPFIRQWTYDVFLSFRGIDTRNNFTSHLYNALHKKGINTFTDNELRKGDEISPTLLKAIEESRISIVILSENFASSTWCLDELTKILECKRINEQMVLPVFYDVDPSEVRHQRNNYGKALTVLEERFKDDSKVQGWKAALKEVANLSGWPVGKGNEHEFILEIVQMVSRIVNRKYLNVAKYPIGMEARVQDVSLLIKIGSNDIIRMVGIFGTGGIDIGIKELIEKSLITIDERSNLEMHDLMQEMGREVVRQESPKEPGNRSRLWFHEDVCHVLEENTATNNVEGILIDLPERDTIHLNPEAFMKMKSLRLFINRNADLTGGPNYLSNELRLLEWPDYPLQSLPSNFHGKKLSVLKMRNSFFKQLGDIFKNFHKLTTLDFSDCQFLTKIPDVSRISSLEDLILDNCTSLVEIHPSVGSLDKLAGLRLLGCSNLGSFPKSLKLPSLEVLMLGGCSSLHNFPEIECKMERIDYIDLKGTPIKELPSSFGFFIGLKDLTLEGCKDLLNLPSSIHHLQHLRRLCLRDCSKLDKFPKKEEDEKQSNDGCSPLVFPALGDIDIGNCVLSGTDFFRTFNCFSTLEQLNLSGNDFVILPECITRFVRLKCLKLEDCKRLKEILELPPKIEEIYASGCMALERFSEVSKRAQFNTCDLPGLEWIDLSRCHKFLKNISMNEVENLLFDQGHFQDHLFGIVFPGNKIPDCFSHCKEVSNKSECEICINEPSHLDGKIKGLALCAVLGVKDGRAPTPIVCSIEIISNGSPSYGDSKAFNLSGSDHVWLLYHVPEYYEIKGDNLQVKFWCSTSLASFRCGAHLVCTRSDTAPSACI